MTHPALTNHLAELELMTPEARAKVLDAQDDIRRIERRHRAGGTIEAYHFALSIAYARYIDAVAAERTTEVPA